LAAIATAVAVMVFKYLIGRRRDQIEPKKVIKSLQDLGLNFSPSGQLVNIMTGEPFVCHNNSQFDQLSDMIINYAQERLRILCDEEKLVRSDHGQPQCSIFTKNISNCSTLLVIIQNKGRERSGIWSCRQVMSVSYDSGSMESYIQMAIKLNYGIIVTNPNHNYEIIDDRQFPIVDSSSPEEHVFSVYRQFISQSKCRDIVFLAVGSGSKQIISLLKKQDELLKKVRGIALVDSTHTLTDLEGKPSLLELFQRNSINWIASKEPFGTALKDMSGSPCYSGGHTQNTYCISKSQNSIFQFFNDKLQ